MEKVRTAAVDALWGPAVKVGNTRRSVLLLPWACLNLCVRWRLLLQRYMRNLGSLSFVRGFAGYNAIFMA